MRQFWLGTMVLAMLMLASGDGSAQSTTATPPTNGPQVETADGNFPVNPPTSGTQSPAPAGFPPAQDSPTPSAPTQPQPAALPTQPAAPPALTTPPDDGSLGEATQAVNDLKSLSPKTLIFVFDVSGSMRGTNLKRAREATINILREAANVGDRAVLFTFGAGTEKAFDTTIATNAEKDALIEKVPYAARAGAGSNIRQPHHEALKILEQTPNRAGAIILLTDSYNDQPKAGTPEYAEYVKYYTPGGRLTKYPDTPQNRDYERLLAKLVRSRKVNAYGIGVQIDEAGRPREQLPQAAPDTAFAPPPIEPTPVETPKEGIPGWVLWAAPLGLLALAIPLVLLLAGSGKPVAVRVTGAPSGPKDFTLRGGDTLTLGGGSAFAGNKVAIPGTGEALATVRANRGEMRIAPGDGKAAAKPLQNAAPGTGNQTAGARVYHNGLPLEREMPLRFGDEVRVTVPDAAAGVATEHRLRFEDASVIPSAPPRRKY